MKPPALPLLPYSPSCLEEVFSETHIYAYYLCPLAGLPLRFSETELPLSRVLGTGLRRGCVLSETGLTGL
jgi:hypothetical protein